MINNQIDCLICNKEEWSPFAVVNHKIVSFKLTIWDNCGFVIQNPPLSIDYLNKYYNNNYIENNYGNDISTLHKTFEPVDESRIQYLIKNNLLSDLNYVLEIGPGAGTMMKKLKNKGINVIGIEPDTNAANWLKKNVNDKIYNGFFDEIYSNNINKWSKEQFDAVIIFHVLEHIHDPIKFLLKIKKTLKPEGKIIIEVPNIKRPYSDTNKWEDYCDPGHLYYFSFNTLNVILNQSEFEIITMTDKIFEPYGNIFCVASNKNPMSKKVNYDDFYDNPEEIKHTWYNFVKYHSFHLFKNKVISKLKKVF